mmetsp:Transcript_2360/g.6381  ORF Transcript_2360/g.6381 Transcript_2360/m.6381 type:complete len:633 (-) Transcript_2360:882-2780(-)
MARGVLGAALKAVWAAAVAALCGVSAGYAAQPVKYVAMPNLHLEALGVEGADGAGISVFRGVREGLVGAWSACAPTMAGADLASCYLQSEYSERLNIHFGYDVLPPERREHAKLPPMQIGPPSVAVVVQSETHKVKPVLLSFSHEPMRGSGSFVIGFECEPLGAVREVLPNADDPDTDDASTAAMKASTAPVIAKSAMIELEWKVPTYHMVRFHWLKVCGSGRHSRVEFNCAPDLGRFSSSFGGQNRVVRLSLTAAKRALQHGERRELRLEIAASAVARTSSNDMSVPIAKEKVTVSEFRVTLTVNGVLQFIEAPAVSVANHTVVSAAVKSTFARGGGVLEGVTSSVRAEQHLILDVAYQCHAEGMTTIALCLSLPPFDIPTCVAWRKKCGKAQTAPYRGAGEVESNAHQQIVYEDLRIACTNQFDSRFRFIVRRGLVHSRFVPRAEADYQAPPPVRIMARPGVPSEVKFVLLLENSGANGVADLNDEQVHPSAKIVGVRAEESSESAAGELATRLIANRSAFCVSFNCKAHRAGTVRVSVNIIRPVSSLHRLERGTGTQFDFQLRIVCTLNEIKNTATGQNFRASEVMKAISRSAILLTMCGSSAVLGLFWWLYSAVIVAAHRKRSELLVA